MPPKSNVPIRICGSKTRTGCRTCKQRHVKCDEGRPVCLKCQKARRQCSYDRPSPPTSVSDQEAEGWRLKVSWSRDHSVSPALLHDLSLYGPHDVAEVSAVKSFATYLGKELAGCFSDEIWCSVLPRAAQHESSIWHAAVAVGLLNINNRLEYNRCGDGSRTAMAVKHYIRAIQELNIRLASHRDMHCRDVVLLSCILFTVFECLQSQYLSALRHVRGGLKLLVAWTSEAQGHNEVETSSYVSYTNLQPIFLALDSQAVQMGVADFQESISLSAMYDGLRTPTAFMTLEEAHLWLNRIFNRLSRWAHWTDPSAAHDPKRPADEWMTSEMHKLEHQLSAWDFAFDVSLQCPEPPPSILLLLVQRRIIQVCFERELGGQSEMVWDQHLALFQEAVEYAEAYTEARTDSYQINTASNKPGFEHPSSSRPIFTVAMDIVMSLYLIGAKCRNAQVRRRALKMLKVCGRREGIWDSESCARIAEKIIELEEAAAFENGFIPESARICTLDVRLGEDRTGEIIYMKLVPNEDGTYRMEQFKEAFVW